MHHSDQGNLYRASLYQRLLARRGVVPSMSRKGNCLVHHRQFQNQAEAQTAIVDYIERFYNRQRLHQARGCRSPEEFEQQEAGS